MKPVVKKKKPSVVRLVALPANKQELKMLENVKQFHKRSSDADTIRFLLIQENEKILNETARIGANATTGA